MADDRPSTLSPSQPAWQALAPQRRRNVAEPPAQPWTQIELEPFVEVLRAVYAAGVEEGRRSRAP